MPLVTLLPAKSTGIGQMPETKEWVATYKLKAEHRTYRQFVRQRLSGKPLHMNRYIESLGLLLEDVVALMNGQYNLSREDWKKAMTIPEEEPCSATAPESTD